MSYESLGLSDVQYKPIEAAVNGCTKSDRTQAIGIAMASLNRADADAAFQRLHAKYAAGKYAGQEECLRQIGKATDAYSHVKNAPIRAAISTGGGALLGYILRRSLKGAVAGAAIGFVGNLIVGVYQRRQIRSR